jgi:hypothetical protein
MIEIRWNRRRLIDDTKLAGSRTGKKSFLPHSLTAITLLLLFESILKALKQINPPSLTPVFLRTAST